MKTALREVDHGIIEATQPMGASMRQIITHVLLPKARPGIIAATSVTAITLVSYTAMAGVVGRGSWVVVGWVIWPYVIATNVFRPT